MLRIGVISDTHNFLDPKVPELFAGVDHILHAGDIGQARLILELEGIAPVTADLGKKNSGRQHKGTRNSGLEWRQVTLPLNYKCPPPERTTSTLVVSPSP